MPREHELNGRNEAGEPVLVSERLAATEQRVLAMRVWAGLALGVHSRFSTNLEHAIAAFRDIIAQGGYMNNNLDERVSDAVWSSFSDWLRILLSYNIADTNAEVDKVHKMIDDAVTAVMDDSFLAKNWLAGDVPRELILTNRA